MRQVVKVVRSVVAVAAFVGLTACATLEEDHGFVPSAVDLEEVAVGLDTRDTVATILGRPSAEGIVDDRGWYYVRSDYERFLWRAPVEVNREVVAVSFTEQGVVQNIERFGLEDGEVVILSRRVTDSNVQGVSFLRQLFSNLGNFSLDQFVGDN